MDGDGRNGDVKFNMRVAQGEGRRRHSCVAVAAGSACVRVLLCLHSPNEQLAAGRLLTLLARGKRSHHGPTTAAIAGRHTLIY